MKIDDILEIIEELSHSQGFYGRLLEGLLETKQEDPENWEEVVKILEGLNFQDTLDLVRYFEEGGEE